MTTPMARGSYGSPIQGYYDVGDIYAVSNTVSGTGESGLYQSERWSPTGMTYTFDVPNGEYEVRLHFAEIYANYAGFRKFDVAVQGSRVIDDLDIYANVGKFFALVENVTASVTNGELTIEFVPGMDSPKINAIELHEMQGTTPVTPGPTDSPTGATPTTPAPSTMPTQTPTTEPTEPTPNSSVVSIYINAGGTVPFEDADGHVWEPDAGYNSNGDTYSTSVTVSGTNKSLLYQSERYNLDAAVSLEVYLHGRERHI